MKETIKVDEKFSVVTTDQFARNDIIVFDYYGPDYASPINESGEFKLHWEKRVFRLIASSGDSVEIKEGDVFVNGKFVPLPPTARIIYQVLSKEPVSGFPGVDPDDILVEKNGDIIEYRVFLTTEQADAFRTQHPDIISLKKISPDIIGAVNDTLFAKASETGNWSSYNYGPLRVPAPGETIDINSVNLKLYHNIPEIKMGALELKEKLYFVLGDNRYAAEDSRYIGLIPQSNMYGVVK